MFAKQLIRWSFVVCLLATLPVMTAALAQGPLPETKAVLPEVTEPGESVAPYTHNVFETENNDSRAKADTVRLNDVIGGHIGWPGDVDFFRLDVDYNWHGFFLVDIDAETRGSFLDAVVCIYDDDIEVDCSDDTDTHDSLVFQGYTYSGIGEIYITVTDYSGRGNVTDYHYELIVSAPVLVSAAAGGLGIGNVAGIPFQSQDILAYSQLNTGDEKWVMFFDGSDVGVTKNLWNLSAGYFDQFWSNDDILIGLAAIQTLPGVGQVTPFDIVRFAPEQYGPITEGDFVIDWPNLYLKGAEWNLTTAGEKIDAIASTNNWLPGDLVSTTGTAKVFDDILFPNNIVTAQDEDLLEREYEDDDYAPEYWNLFFDGTSVPGLKGEDVCAAAFDGSVARIYLTILGNGIVRKNRVSQKDIFALNYPSLTWGGVIWHGPAHGWNYNIDAFDIGGR